MAIKAPYWAEAGDIPSTARFVRLGPWSEMRHIEKMFVAQIFQQAMKIYSEFHRKTECVSANTDSAISTDEQKLEKVCGKVRASKATAGGYESPEKSVSERNPHSIIS